MTRNRLTLVILLLAGLIVWMLYYWDPTSTGTPSGRAQGALDLAPRPVGGDFQLHSAQGPVRLADLRGQVVLIYFGYAACPDVCPTNLAFIASALRGLQSDELERVRVLFVSVDPERDSLERLSTYAGYFHPSIQGVTGAPGEVAEVARRYGAVYRRAPESDTAMGYLVDHSAYTYVVDPAGKLVRTLGHATPPEEMRAIIRGLLAAPEDQPAGR